MDDSQGIVNLKALIPVRYKAVLMVNPYPLFPLPPFLTRETFFMQQPLPHSNLGTGECLQANACCLQPEACLLLAAGSMLAACSRKHACQTAWPAESIVELLKWNPYC